MLAVAIGEVVGDASRPGSHHTLALMASARRCYVIGSLRLRGAQPPGRTVDTRTLSSLESLAWARMVRLNPGNLPCLLTFLRGTSFSFLNPRGPNEDTRLHGAGFCARDHGRQRASPAAYAYSNSSCEVWVDVKEAGGTIAVSVRDEGVGLPADFDLSSGKRLGMRLVTALAAQVEANLTVNRLAPGTEFLINLPTRELHKT